MPRKGLVRYLVEHGADINKENWVGETPLFKACECGNEDLVSYLIEHGADVNKGHGCFFSPLRDVTGPYANCPFLTTL